MVSERKSLTTKLPDEITKLVNEITKLCIKKEECSCFIYFFALIDPTFSKKFVKIKKIDLNFYFHYSFWYIKKFYDGLYGVHKSFWGITKKCENKQGYSAVFIVNFEHI